MAKKIIGFIKLQIPAGKANPSPPIGPALGQRGLNIMEFCKAFNAQTQAHGTGSADSGRDHRVRGQVLHVRDEDAAGYGSDQEGSEASTRVRQSRIPTRSARSPALKLKKSPRPRCPI